MTPQEFRSYRRQCGLTQTQLADLLGVTQRAVTKWETGAARMRPMLEFALRWLTEHPEYHRPSPAASDH